MNFYKTKGEGGNATAVHAAEPTAFPAHFAPCGRATKLRPGNSEVTKLKGLWLTLSDDARSYWQELFVSPTSQAEIRKLLLAQLKVNLRFDKQLNQFRDWELEQRARDVEAERQLDDERELKSQFGEDWSLDQIREEVLRRSYARALQTGDFAAGRKTIVQDLNVKKVALDERKLLLLEKKAAAFDQAKEVLGNKDLGEDEKRQRMLQLFGM